VSVRTELDLPTLKAREGDLATVVFHIQNEGENVVVLRDLTFFANPRLKESASAAASWQFAQDQYLDYSPERDEWAYDRNRPARDSRRPMVFNSGVLVPRESITVRTRLRLLGMPKHFQLLYFEISPEDLRRKIYWETRQDRETKYRTLVGKDLDARLVPSPDKTKAGHRVVIFPHAEPIVQPNASILPITVEADLVPRSYPLSRAVQQTGGETPEQYTYSMTFDGWVLRKSDGFFLVSPRGAFPLPELRQMERIFYIFDTVPLTGRLQVDLRGDAITQTMQENGYTLVALPKDPQKHEERTRYSLFIESPKMLKLFELVRRLKLAIDAELSSDGSGKLIVTR
jgi:hypothetical protein